MHLDVLGSLNCDVALRGIGGVAVTFFFPAESLSVTPPPKTAGHTQDTNTMERRVLWMPKECFDTERVHRLAKNGTWCT